MSYISDLDTALDSIASLAEQLENMECATRSIMYMSIEDHDDSFRINTMQHICEYLNAAVRALDNANRATSEALKSACDVF